ncbi:hypothetical protein BM221_000196 [Beauveria bassiana]|uniref:Uncharacterized protein n=1 Tax=Beauveria bassiana TaxID=176275 RepID=A0A2N6NZS3_BEABA|nr:hypothetical protein BM221_000196 [Beauveria bassiana]
MPTLCGIFSIPSLLVRIVHTLLNMRTDVPPLTTANDWTRLDYLLHHKLFHRNPESATRFRAPSARELFCYHQGQDLAAAVADELTLT